MLCLGFSTERRLEINFNIWTTFMCTSSWNLKKNAACFAVHELLNLQPPLAVSDGAMMSDWATLIFQIVVPLLWWPAVNPQALSIDSSLELVTDCVDFGDDSLCQLTDYLLPSFLQNHQDSTDYLVLLMIRIIQHGSFCCCDVAGRVKSVMRHSLKSPTWAKSRESKIFLLLVLKKSVFLFHTAHAIICILSSNFPDISHPQPWWWRVRDPPHLFGPRLGPHRVWCGVPFWRAVGHRALGQRGGTRERRGGRGRSIICLHLRQRLLAGAGTHESGSHQPISRKHFVGLVTGDGEGSRTFHTMDVFSDKRLFLAAFSFHPQDLGHPISSQFSSSSPVTIDVPLGEVSQGLLGSNQLTTIDHSELSAQLGLGLGGGNILQRPQSPEHPLSATASPTSSLQDDDMDDFRRVG